MLTPLTVVGRLLDDLHVHCGYDRGAVGIALGMAFTRMIGVERRAHVKANVRAQGVCVYICVRVRVCACACDGRKLAAFCVP